MKLRVIFIQLVLLILLSAASHESCIAQETDTVTVKISEGQNSADLIDDSDGDAMQSTDSGYVVIRHVPDSIVAAYKKDKAFAYANDPSYWKTEPDESPSPFWTWLARYSGVIQFIIFAGVIAIVLFTLYRI